MHLWHMDYLTKEEMDTKTTKEGTVFEESTKIPGCNAIKGKGGHELSHWCKGTESKEGEDDTELWIKLADNKKCAARTCRPYVTEEDRNTYKVREKNKRMLIFAEINFIPAGDYRKFWVRVRIPKCSDSLDKRTVKLHLSVPFFQSERSITHKYHVCSSPKFTEKELCSNKT